MTDFFRNNQLIKERVVLADVSYDRYINPPEVLKDVTCSYFPPLSAPPPLSPFLPLLFGNTVFHLRMK